MSELLDAIIAERRQNAIDYQQYLAKLLEAAKQLGTKESDTKYPDWADNGARRALVDFFHPNDVLAIQVDTAIWHTKPDGWVGNPMKEKVVRNAIKRTLPADFDKSDELFELVKARHEYQ